MRDPKRIPLILERLRVAWETAPDMRLGQILAACGRDPFYVEDDVMIEKIELMLNCNAAFHKADANRDA